MATAGKSSLSCRVLDRWFAGSGGEPSQHFEAFPPAPHPLDALQPAKTDMQAILKSINDNAGAINLLFSLVVAGATVFYAVLTHRLVSETKRMREVQTEPALSIWIEPSEHGINFINLVIQNSGQGPAHGITLKSIPNFQRSKGQYVADLGLFKHGIKHLAAGQRIVFFLTSILDEVHGHGEDLSRLDFTVQADYESTVGRKYSDTFAIHFESYEGYGTIGEPPLISIARDIEKIQKDLGHVASGFRKVQVVVNTRRDIARDYEKVVARHKAMEARAAPAASDYPISPDAADERATELTSKGDLEKPSVAPEAEESSDSGGEAA